MLAGFAPDASPDVLRDPEVTFGAGTGWTVRFADVDLPGLQELGVLVTFDADTVTHVDDLADADFA